MGCYRIGTEEGQKLELELAGYGSRAAAGVLDLSACGLGTLVLVLSFLFLRRLDETHLVEFGLAFLVGASLALPALWQVGFALRSRETPGKRMLGLSVIDRSGAPASIGQCVLRALFLGVELLPMPLPLGLMVIFAHPQSCRLGDLVAGTLVVRKGNRPVGTWDPRRTPTGVNAERIANYRKDLTPARLAQLGASDHALLSDLDARLGLRVAVRRDLEHRLAGHFAGRFGLEEPNSPKLFLAALGEALLQVKSPG